MEEAARLRMPAEWEPHQATWLGWPKYEPDWPKKFEPVPHVFTEILRHSTKNEKEKEKMNILVADEASRKHAEDVLCRATINWFRVNFFSQSYTRNWLRDIGPLFTVREGKKKAVICAFNGWGEQYPDYQKDAQVALSIAQFAGVQPVPMLYNFKPVVLEGGAIDVDGTGNLLATEECLLSKKRNPEMSKEDYEVVFKRFLGVNRIIWLKGSIAGDETGHTDNVARFVAPGHVAAAVEDTKADANYKILKENYARLKESGLRITEVPMPHPLYFDNQRLPASYQNFYILNGLVLVPTFNDSFDCDAIMILRSLFPTREVVGINSVDLVWGLGTIHCSLQQEPAD